MKWKKTEKCGSDHDHTDEKMNRIFYSVRMQSALHKDGGRLIRCGLENRMIIRKRVRGVSEALLDEVRKYGPDLFLIEADGARRLPCKVPESWEPVIYQKRYTGAGSLRSGRSGKVLSGGVFSSRAGSRNFGEEDNRPDISSGYCAAGT